MIAEPIANQMARTYYRVRAPGALPILEELTGSQWWPAERLRDLQERRLLALLKHAFANVPYYRNVLAELGAHAEDFTSLDDLRRLPVLTRSDLVTHRDALIGEGIQRGGLIWNSSGGSTGQPVSVYQDRRYWRYGFASMWRAWFLFPGYDLGVRRLRIWGADRDEPHKLLRAVLRTLFNELFINTFRASETDLDHALDEIGRYRPSLLLAYASSAELLARRALQRGMELTIPSIVSTAESLSAAQRAMLERTFSARVHNCYGCREVGAIAQECEVGNGLHVNVETQVVELEALDPAQPDGPHRVLVTQLHNFAMPLIRYELGDLARNGRISWSRCECGRALPRMGEVVGRTSDIIRTPSGRFVHGEYFTHLFYGQHIVGAFEVHQKTLDRIALRIVPLPGSEASELIERIRSTVAEDLGIPHVEVEVCTEIQPGPTGKFRFVRSDVAGGRGIALDPGVAPSKARQEAS